MWAIGGPRPTAHAAPSHFPFLLVCGSRADLGVEHWIGQEPWTNVGRSSPPAPSTIRASQWHTCLRVPKYQSTLYSCTWDSDPSICIRSLIAPCRCRFPLPPSPRFPFRPPTLSLLIGNQTHRRCTIPPFYSFEDYWLTLAHCLLANEAIPPSQVVQLPTTLPRTRLACWPFTIRPQSWARKPNDIHGGSGKHIPISRVCHWLKRTAKATLEPIVRLSTLDE